MRQRPRAPFRPRAGGSDPPRAHDGEGQAAMPRLGRLTPREIEILGLILHGLHNKEDRAPSRNQSAHCGRGAFPPHEETGRTLGGVPCANSPDGRC